MAAVTRARREWPGYTSVWRWHFYAGLFCIPFVLWLAITGSVYLFRPQIEAWIDRPFAHVATVGPRESAARQAAAAIAAVPGSVLHRYQLPDTPTQAVQIIVGKGKQEVRVYVHPQNLAVLKTVDEDQRLMRIVFRLHGELLAGNPGSYLVELAASWAIVMVLSGLFLWWPRGRGPAGVIWPRLRAGGRRFWRDLHAVTGFLVFVHGAVPAAVGVAVGEKLGELPQGRADRGRGSSGSAGLDHQPRHRVEGARRSGRRNAGHDGGTR